MAQRNLIDPINGKSSGPGFLGYLMIVMWFLLTIMASTTVRAETAPGPVTLTAADILPDIETALAARGAPAGAQIVLNNPAQAFALTGPAAFAHVSYSPASGRFVVRLASAPVAIAGHARISETVPVLAHDVARGEIITERDIAYMETAGMGGDRIVRDAADLIGKETRRPLRAQTPLRPTDVAARVLVRKGALVTLFYGGEGLRLTLQGVAMNSGTEGDVVSIRNIESERVLKGVVKGENFVAIAAPRVLIPSVEG